MAETKDLTINQGKTFNLVFRWETQPIVYKAITAISQSAPVRLTVPEHGAPNGWSMAVTNVKGMTEINAAANAIKDKDYHEATVIDPNTIEFNEINAAGFKPYVSGGFIQYNTPDDLTGCRARMQIRDKVGGTVQASTELVDSPLNILTITINEQGKYSTLSISATDTATITWKKGTYDIEMVSPSGTVTALLTGAVTVTKEITT